MVQYCPTLSLPSISGHFMSRDSWVSHYYSRYYTVWTICLLTAHRYTKESKMAAIRNISPIHLIFTCSFTRCVHAYGTTTASTTAAGTSATN